MIYLKICLAAIERYQLEKPLRDMYRDVATRKEKNMSLPFDKLVSYLVSRDWFSARTEI